jgi:hypothetical protein
MFQILERGAPELVTRAPDVPPDLARVVQRCLERRRDDRFASARELHAALSACQTGRTAFSLERETAALIREVLGARIREREEMMHRAYERFAPSALARTDTLPIAGAETPPPLVRPVAAISQPVARGGSPSGRRRWPLLLALFALFAVVGVLARESTRPSESVATRANQPAPEREAVDARGSAGNGGGSAPGAGGAPSAGAADEGAQSGRDGGSMAPTPTTEREPPARAKDETRLVASKPAPSAGPPPSTRPQARRKASEPARAPPVESATPSNPFDAKTRIDDNPYADRVRLNKATPPQPAPAETAPPAPAETAPRDPAPQTSPPPSRN